MDRLGRVTDECSIEGCPRPLRVRQVSGYEGGGGLCQMHLIRFRKTGSTGPATALRRNSGEGHLKDGYLIQARVLEHRRVMSEMLGRPLRDWEYVHHRNTVRHDNRPENLELWISAQPKGGRLSEVLAFFVQNYPDELRELLA